MNKERSDGSAGEKRAVPARQTKKGAASRGGIGERLKPDDAFYAHLLEEGPVGLTSVDCDGRIIYANARAEKILGLNRSRIKGRTYDDPKWRIAGLDGRPYPKDALPFEIVRKTGKPVRDIRHAIEWPDGRRVCLSISGNPLKSPGGRFKGAVFAQEDITAEIALQEERSKAAEAQSRSEKFNRSLIDALPVGLLHLDREGVITYENPALRRMMGVPPEAASPVVGKRILDLPPFAAIALAPDFDRLRKGESVQRKGVPWRSLMGPSLILDVTAVPVFEAGGIFSGAEVMILDVTEKAEVEKALIESERRYRESSAVLETIFDTIPDVLGLQDEGHRILRYNKAGYAYLKTTPEKVKGKRCFELIGRDGPCDVCATSEAYRTKRPARIERYFPEIDSWLDIRSYPVLDESGKVIGALEHLRDITAAKKADIALRQSEEKYRNLIEQSHDAIYLLYDGKFEVINKRFEEMFGVGLGQTNSPEFNFRDMIAPQSLPLIEERERKIRRGESPDPVYEFTAVTPQGKQIECETSVTYIDYKNGKATQGVIRDITERKRARERIEASLREKEVMLKEIHHRVKNNLQIVSSLLNLSSTSIEDPRALRFLQESRNRVRSMALIHDRLYRSSDFARIDLTDYTVGLVNQLFTAYQVAEDRVECEIDISDVRVGLDKAVPVGLLLNELVSNALKYAFPDKEKGRIKVGLIGCGSGECVLTVGDNGIGLPPDVDLSEPRTLGLQIIQSLVGQLDGRLEVVRRDGTTFRIRFPLGR
ncbi:MAG: PAS domain S-box protein [Candidatus Aminicenantes bacterium]|nr:PAS domain S-box protein [Candidatus Aminicenantes bacterium]